MELEMCDRLDQEALGLMALGYRPVIYIELSCPDCGVWRIGLEPEQSPSCPSCEYKAEWTCYELASGFTRQSLPIVEKYLAAPIRERRGYPISYPWNTSVPFLAERNRRAAAYRLTQRKRQAQV
jgi:hypothetical protein